MKRVCLLGSCWLLLANFAVAGGDPVLPGNHPLTVSQAGDLLISELRCAACHAGLEQQSIPEKTAPDLAEAGSRISIGSKARRCIIRSAVWPATVRRSRSTTRRLRSEMRSWTRRKTRG